MESDERAAALLDDHAEDGYAFPADEDYCFERVAPTALSVLDTAPAEFACRTFTREEYEERELFGHFASRVRIYVRR